MCSVCVWSTLKNSRTRLSLDPPDVTVIPCRETDGEILITIPSDATPPVKAYWSGAQSFIHHSQDPLRATHLSVGDYQVHLVDARRRVSGVTTVHVPSVHTPSIVSYTVCHASTDDARDGSVTAQCVNVDVENALFWWTNGARTIGPTLSSVRPGSYVALIISVNDSPVHCLHKCEAATVDVSDVSPNEIVFSQ